MKPRTVLWLALASGIGLLLVLLALISPSLSLASGSPAAAAPEAPHGMGVYVDSGQTLGNAVSHAVALGDLDGDGDLDALTANSSGANPVWRNVGSGFLSSIGSGLGTADSNGVALGDLDGDKDLDALFANDGANQAWENDGSGSFSALGSGLGTADGLDVALGDLDGDNDLDAFFANNGANSVWLNNGSGVLTDTMQSLGSLVSNGVALGDVDGDNDLDAVVANGSTGSQDSKVWLNDGSGNFMDSGQSLGMAWHYAVALGDLDGDNDLDAFLATWTGADTVWINQGGLQMGTLGQFTDSGQSLSGSGSLGVRLGDVDNDTDLDAVVTKNVPDGNEVWLNNGSGAFSDSGQDLGSTTTYAVGLGNLDGDTDLDLFFANFGPDGVWINGRLGLPDAVFDVDRETNDNGEQVYYWASSGDPTLPVMLSQPAPQALDVRVAAQSTAGTSTQTLNFAKDEQIQFVTLVNPMPNPSESITLTLSVTNTAVTPGPGDLTDTLKLVYIDAGQGLDECILCFLEWLGRFLGFNPVFGAMHHMDFGGLDGSPVWVYYTALFDLYSPEVAGIAASNPAILWEGLAALDEWTPAVQSLADGTGALTTITPAMADGTVDWFNALKAEGSAGLRATIQKEQNALNLASFAGLNMDQALAAIQARRSAAIVYLAVVNK